MQMLVSRLLALFRRTRLDARLDEDVRAHLALLEDEYQRRGMSAEAARFAARRAFGAVEPMKEAYRDIAWARWVDDFVQDIGYAARGLRRNPMFAAAVVLTLALGIGANAAIFTQLNAVLVRSLPVRDPERLVAFSAVQPGRDPAFTFSYRTFEAFRRRGEPLEGVAASSPLRLGVSVDGDPSTTVDGLLASGNYHTLLGVDAVVGRTLHDADETAGGAAVAVLGYGFWQQRFGGDAAVVGRTVRLNGYPVTVVGVTEPDFFGTRVGESVAITIPLSLQPQVNIENGTSLVDGRGADDFWLELTGRLRPDVTVTAATAAADRIYQQLMPAIRQGLGPKAARFGHPRLDLQTGGQALSELRRRFSRPLLILMGVVGVVLLIACANVAALLMARNAARHREVAIRVSLGAGRGRLLRLFLSESVLLALAGGAVALLVAAASSHRLAALLVGTGTGELRAPLDVTVFGFTLAVAIVTGLAFGAVPALGLSRLPAFVALRSGGSTLRGGGGLKGRTWLVAGQLALALVLLVGAGLFVRTLSNLRRFDLGFDQQVLTLRLEPRGSNRKDENEARLRQLYRDVVDRVRELPGVTAASLSGSTPLRDENAIAPPIIVPGMPAADGTDTRVRMLQVFPGSFETLGVPLLAGRDLAAPDDDPRAPFVAVVNEAMATRFFGSARAAIGRRFAVPGSIVASRPVEFEIVGVAGNVRDRAVREETVPTAFATFAHTPTGRGQMTLIVRTQNPEALIPALRQVATDMDPLMPVADVESLADRVSATTRQEYLLALLSALFAGVALMLAAVGLYGVIAFAVARRQGELGLRLALGATPRALVAQVVREGLTVAATGVVAGTAVAFVVMRTLSHLWFGLEPFDPRAFGTAMVVLLVTAAAASFHPARRAARVNPIVALRSE